jgi:CRISPR type I-E-associated protein CasB/Cse2
MTAEAREQWREREHGRRANLAEELTSLFKGGQEGSPSTLRDSSPAVLAQWRKALSRTPGEATELAGPISNVLRDTPEGSREERPWEFALHYGLGLFAVHQQSAATTMHAPSRPGRPPNSIGYACRELARVQAQDSSGNPDDRLTRPQYEPVNRGLVRRVDSMVSARTLPELVGHLRGLVPLLRGRGIGVDYVVLTADLAVWSHPALRDRTCYRWGRDFHRPLPRATGTPDSPDSSTTDNKE